jgi:hypothetical protein
MLVFLVGMALSKPLPTPGEAGARAAAGGRGAARTLSLLAAAALALVAAAALALLFYYGQFVEPVVTRTIPKLLESAQGGGVGKETSSWSDYLRDHLVRLSSLGYSLLWPILLGLVGLLAGWKQAVEDPGRRPLRRALLGAWIGTALVFFLVGYRMDMVDKEIWFVLPALALCAAVGLEWLWRRGPAGRIVAVATFLYLGAAGFFFWILRLSSYLQDWVNSDAPVVGELVRRVMAVLGG